MAKPGRNDLCPCGSGKKFKRCHETKQQQGAIGQRLVLLAVAGAMLAALLAAIGSFRSAGQPSSVRIWSPEHGHYHDANGMAVP